MRKHQSAEPGNLPLATSVLGVKLRHREAGRWTRPPCGGPTKPFHTVTTFPLPWCSAKRTEDQTWKPGHRGKKRINSTYSAKLVGNRGREGDAAMGISVHEGKLMVKIKASLGPQALGGAQELVLELCSL